MLLRRRENKTRMKRPKWGWLRSAFFWGKFGVIWGFQWLKASIHWQWLSATNIMLVLLLLFGRRWCGTQWVDCWENVSTSSMAGIWTRIWSLGEGWTALQWALSRGMPVFRTKTMIPLWNRNKRIYLDIYYLSVSLFFNHLHPDITANPIWSVHFITVGCEYKIE